MSVWCLCCSTLQRPVPAEHGNLCADCGNTLLRNLRQIEHCYLALSAIPVTGDTERRAPGFASSSPARDDILVETDPRTKADDHQHVGALAALTSWTHNVFAHHIAPPQGSSITGYCDYLHAHHRWILDQEWVTDYAAELDDIRRRLQALAGFAPEPPTGSCIRVECDGLTYPTDDASGVRCRRCRTLYTGLDLIRLRAAQDTS